jgi:hypothetical protein
MISKQQDGTVLGFVPAWVIAYTKPDQSQRVALNINTLFGDQLKKIDFKVDRYTIDRSQTYNWNNADNSWIPAPAADTTFDLLSHYQLLETFAAGTGYSVGDQIRILGSQLDAQDQTNDVIITVNTVDETGAIESVFYSGIAPNLALGAIYTNIAGINIAGTGTGAAWSFEVVGFDATIFDGGSIRFISPSDRSDIGDRFDKYIIFPKQTILG